MVHCVEISLFYNTSINGNLFLSLFFECVCVYAYNVFAHLVFICHLFGLCNKNIQRKKKPTKSYASARAQSHSSRVYTFFTFLKSFGIDRMYMWHMCYCVLYWFSICYLIIIIGWKKFKVEIYLKASCLFKDCYFFGNSILSLK